LERWNAGIVEKWVLGCWNAELMAKFVLTIKLKMEKPFLKPPFHYSMIGAELWPQKFLIFLISYRNFDTFN
jgi:hypothetical protein